MKLGNRKRYPSHCWSGRQRRTLSCWRRRNAAPGWRCRLRSHVRIIADCAAFGMYESHTRAPHACSVFARSVAALCMWLVEWVTCEVVVHQGLIRTVARGTPSGAFQKMRRPHRSAATAWLSNPPARGLRRGRRRRQGDDAASPMPIASWFCDVHRRVPFDGVRARCNGRRRRNVCTRAVQIDRPPRLILADQASRCASRRSRRSCASPVAVMPSCSQSTCSFSP